MNNVFIDAAAVGGTILGSGAGLRLIVGSIKLFVKDILPLIQQKGGGNSPIQQPVMHCKNHDTMDITVSSIDSIKTTLVRIETKLERATEDRDIMSGLSERLHKAETEIQLLKAQKVIL